MLSMNVSGKAPRNHVLPQGIKKGDYFTWDLTKPETQNTKRQKQEPQAKIGELIIPNTNKQQPND